MYGIYSQLVSISWNTPMGWDQLAKSLYLVYEVEGSNPVFPRFAYQKWICAVGRGRQSVNATINPLKVGGRLWSCMESIIAPKLNF